MSCFFVSAMMLYYGLTDLIDDLFSCLGKGGMEHLHLLGEVCLQPLVLLDDVLDELDSLLAVDLDSPFSFLPAVEPCLRPPSDSASVWIDADQSRNIKTLDVYLQFSKGINKSATGYGFVIGFFFTA